MGRNEREQETEQMAALANPVCQRRREMFIEGYAVRRNAVINQVYGLRFVGLVNESGADLHEDALAGTDSQFILSPEHKLAVIEEGCAVGQEYGVCNPNNAMKLCVGGGRRCGLKPSPFCDAGVIAAKDAEISKLIQEKELEK